MNVLIAAPLRTYTRKPWVDASGDTLDAVIADLDRQYPGIRHRMIDEQGRMRPHVRFFVNGAQTFELSLPLAPSDQVMIVQALSGG